MTHSDTVMKVNRDVGLEAKENDHKGFCHFLSLPLSFLQFLSPVVSSFF